MNIDSNSSEKKNQSDDFLIVNTESRIFKMDLRKKEIKNFSKHLEELAECSWSSGPL